MKFITTTLPYVNSRAHIGHALEMFQGDAISRWFRQNHEVIFNTGLDEHGLKVHTKAIELGLDTQEYCNQQAQAWLDFMYAFHIDYDVFYRTTSEEHKRKVQEFWNKCLENGDLYKKEYTGNYCVGCESFKTDSDLVDGKCPDHNVAPQPTSEENWFFRTTKYTDNILKWLDESEEFLTPRAKINELKNIVANAEDISVSRNKKAVSWGIPVPNDDEQVIYVWFEALLNYIFAAGSAWDGETIQLCGPDNLRFQGHLFQAILESAGMKHTTRLLVHGTVLDGEGKKMSKSIGNVVDPVDQLAKYGIDAVRYYALAGLTTCADGNWNETDLVKLYNTELADDFGNLVARVIHLIDTKGCEVDESLVPEGFKFGIDAELKNIDNLWDSLRIHEALKQANSVLKIGNKYINDKKPWSEPDYVETLNSLYYLLSQVNTRLSPAIPDACEAVRECLSVKKKSIIFPKK